MRQLLKTENVLVQAIHVLVNVMEKPMLWRKRETMCLGPGASNPTKKWSTRSTFGKLLSRCHVFEILSIVFKNSFLLIHFYEQSTQ